MKTAKTTTRSSAIDANSISVIQQLNLMMGNLRQRKVGEKKVQKWVSVFWTATASRRVKMIEASY